LADAVALLRSQFDALQSELERLREDLGRAYGELDSAQVRNAALEREVERLRRLLPR
jgi:chromosome segregation ATPase